METVLLLGGILLVRFACSYLSPRTRPQHPGVIISADYRRKLASASYDYQNRSDFRASARKFR